MTIDKFREYLVDIISEILIKYGPDGHCDGADYIAEFVLALSINTQKEWLDIHLPEYENNKGII